MSRGTRSQHSRAVIRVAAAAFATLRDVPVTTVSLYVAVAARIGMLRWPCPAHIEIDTLTSLVSILCERSSPWFHPDSTPGAIGCCGALLHVLCPHSCDQESSTLRLNVN